MFSEEAPECRLFTERTNYSKRIGSIFKRNSKEYNYQEVRTPFMMNQEVWERSGHWGHYKDNMYFSEVDNKSFALKPMNCPGHMLMFKINCILIVNYRFVCVNLVKYIVMNLVVR